MYTEKANVYFGFAREEMMPFVPTSAKTILEVGCGEGGFAAALKAKRDVHITAIEAYADAAKVASSRVDEIFTAGLEEALPLLKTRQFDCIVMNDVIEHLADPWDALRQLRPFLKPLGGRFVASIPNVRYLPVFKSYLQDAQWRYERSGVMDRTHLRFFTHRSMADLFADTGYVVDTIVGINSVRSLPLKLGLVNRLLGGALNDVRFQQYACTASRGPD